MMATQRKDDGPGREITKKRMPSPSSRQSTTQSSKNALIPPSEKRLPNYLKATLSSRHSNPSSVPPAPQATTKTKQPSSSITSNTTAAAASRTQHRPKPTLNRRRSFDKPPPPSATTHNPLQKSQTFLSSHPSPVDRRRSLDKPPSPSRFHKSSQSNTTNSNSVIPIMKSSSVPKLGQARSLKLAPKDGGKSYSLYTGINSFKKITKDMNPSTSTDVSTTKAAPLIRTDSSPDHDRSTAAPAMEPQITGENQESLLVRSSDFEEVQDSDIDQLSTTESVPAAALEEKVLQVDLPEKKVQVHGHDDEDLKSHCDSSSPVLEDQNESMDVETEGPRNKEIRTLPVDEESNDRKEDRYKDENDNESPAKPENDNENENSSGKALNDQELEVNDRGNEPEQESEPKLKPEPESELESEPKLKPEAKAEPEPEGKGEVQNVGGATRQGGEGKKESAAVYNDVIEQTASKLLEKKKNKVKALVGAFETVMSLQEPEA